MAEGTQSTAGAVMHLATTGRVQPVAGAACVVMGVCMGALVLRAGEAVADPVVLGVAAAGFTGFGAWLAGRRTSVVLDRDAMTATARWRWLFLHGEETVSARGKSLIVERTIHRTKDSSSETFAVVLDGVTLRKVTELEGGAEEAAAAARRMAAHLGIPFAGQRDSAATRRAEARRRKAAKYAIVPLLIVVAAMLLMFVAMVLLGRVG